MPLSSLSGSLNTEIKWTAQNNLTGSVYSPITQAGDIRKQYPLKNTVANNASGGADEVFSFQQTITGSGSATVDLTAMTNVLQQTSVNVVRIKGYQIRLLDATDDGTIVTPGSTSITVTNNGPALPNKLDFGSKGSGLTLTLTASGTISAVAIGAAGTGYPPSSSFLVAPNQAGGSGGVISVTTNGSGVPTAVAVVAAGSGYAGATVPSTEIGFYSINSGGAHMYFDVLAAGFVAVDSTHKNITILNNDAIHTATVEIDVFACTS